MTPDEHTVFGKNLQRWRTDVIVMHMGDDDRFNPRWMADVVPKEFFTFGLRWDSTIDQQGGPARPQH